MMTTVSLTITCAHADICGQLASVLAPDNKGAPRGMLLKMAVKKDVLRFQMTSDSPSTTVSSALAVLRDALLFQEVWLLSRGERPESMGGAEIA